MNDVDYIRQRLIENLEELAQLVPALTQALQKDHTPETGNRIAISGITLTIPVNTDVLRALHEIPISYLPYAQADWEHANTTGNENAAKQISRDIDHWRRLAKRALGLLHYNRPLGQPCPQHDQPLTELVARGDEGWIRHDSRGPYVHWQHNQQIWCRHCGSTWEPRQLLLLGRLLKWAARRRAENTADQHIAA